MNRAITKLRALDKLQHHRVDGQQRLVYQDINGEMWLDYTTRINFNPWTGEKCEQCLVKTSEIINEDAKMMYWE